MKAGNGQHFEQSYNAQAAVEIESRLIVSQSVTDEANDKKQLVPVTQGIISSFKPEMILADSGYNSEEVVGDVETAENGTVTGVIVLVPAKRTHHHRSVKDLEKPTSKDEGRNTAGESMDQRMARSGNRKAYKQRKQTVEPVFGIIKEAMGFRRFSMRGKHRAENEWAIVTCAYNVKRLFHIGASCVPNPNHASEIEVI